MVVKRRGIARFGAEPGTMPGPPHRNPCAYFLSLWCITPTQGKSLVKFHLVPKFHLGTSNFRRGLRAGLVLGGDRLLELLKAKAGEEEVAWTARQESSERRKSAARLVAVRQSERKWKAWVLARLGGERGWISPGNWATRMGVRSPTFSSALKPSSRTVPRSHNALPTSGTHSNAICQLSSVDPIS